MPLDIPRQRTVLWQMVRDLPEQRLEEHLSLLKQALSLLQLTG